MTVGPGSENSGAPSGPVAQWTERRFPKPGVGGSIPPGATIS